MRLTQWQPYNSLWNRLQQFHSEMNRLFDRGVGEANDTFAAAGFPAVNVWEEDEDLWVEAELPGLNLNDLEIYVTGDDQLTIKGERKASVPEKGVQHRQERSYGQFVRVLTLPFAVDPNRVDARFEHGVLRLRLSKHESAKPRKIIVKGE
jgi:HSP20 family protein